MQIPATPNSAQASVFSTTNTVGNFWSLGGGFFNATTEAIATPMGIRIAHPKPTYCDNQSCKAVTNKMAMLPSHIPSAAPMTPPKPEQAS